jgi:hypothetical protein
MTSLISRVRAALTLPFSIKYRLIGDKTTRKIPLQEITGLARSCIVHSLTFHGVPQQIDNFIDRLPEEEALQKISSLQKDYLSFTVYSLKQMVASKIISAETAWILFYGQWGSIGRVDETSFGRMRSAFWTETRSLVNNGGTSGPSLLEFEFYARAGTNGLAQFEKYNEWANNIEFDPETCRDMPEAVRQEYKKALWLEMRIIEGQVGISGLNKDVERFKYDQENGSYDSKTNEVKGSISLYRGKVSMQSSGTVDCVVKAEIGHWLFARFLFLFFKWEDELMDRMNMSGFSKAQIESYAQMGGPTSPEIYTFLLGGYYVAGSSRKLDSGDGRERYPLYPRRIPRNRVVLEEKIDHLEPHTAAEYVERLIRDKLIEAEQRGDIDASEVYSYYRKTGLYVALLYLERLESKAILEKIKSFDLKEINDYFDNWAEKRKSAIAKILKMGSYHERDVIIRVIERFQESWAIPHLERLIDKGDLDDMCNAARALLSMRTPVSTDRKVFLQTLSLYEKFKIDEIVKLGRAAFPALRVLVERLPQNHRRGHIIKAIGEIGGREALEILDTVDTLEISDKFNKLDLLEDKLALAYYRVRNGQQEARQVLEGALLYEDGSGFEWEIHQKAQKYLALLKST